MLAYGSIFDDIRPEHKFFSCPLCLGFWVGIFWHFLFFLCGVYLLPNPENVFPLLSFIIFPFISSIVSYWGCMIIGDDGIKFDR